MPISAYDCAVARAATTSDVFNAIAEPQRREILTLLRAGEWPVTELAQEAAADPTREATVVAIGIHPFVVGTPSGAAALRRVLENLKSQKLVWLTDVQAVYDASGTTK